METTKNKEKTENNTDKKQKKQKQKKTKLEKLFKTLHRIEFVTFRWLAPYKKHGCLEKHNDRGYLYVGNHFSVYDVVYPCMVTDKPMHFVAKSELWESRFWRYFCNKTEAIMVKRDGNDVKAVMEMMKTLKSGGMVNIFPEGTRNKSFDSFLPFKGGISAISIKTKSPIVPFAVVYKTRLFRRNHIIYGEPVEFSEYYGQKITDEIAHECDEKIRDIIWNMRQDYLESVKKKKQK